MADSQAWQTPFDYQPWSDHPTSSRGMQPQPEINPTTVPGSSSVSQIDQGKFSVELGSFCHFNFSPGLHHVDYSLPQWQTLTHDRGHPGFDSEASMLQPVSAQPAGGPNSGLIITPPPQWQPMAAQFGSANSGLIPSSLSQPELQAHTVPTQLGVSFNSGRIPPSLQSQWQPSGQIPSQWQASAPQSVPTQYRSSNSELPPSQPQWQAPPSLDSHHSSFHPPFPLSDTHRSESPANSFQANITENLGHVKTIRMSHKRNSEQFTVFGDTKRARLTGTRVPASDVEPLLVLPDVKKNLKNLAYENMVRSVFELGLFPVPNEITTMANAALDTAIGSNSNYLLLLILYYMTYH